MSSLTADVKGNNVAITADRLSVELDDGRSLSVPLAWYPRLLHGIPAERNNWRLIGNAEGIHWPELDEDISLENLLQGNPSGESQASLRKWLAKRESGLSESLLALSISRGTSPVTHLGSSHSLILSNLRISPYPSWDRSLH